MPTDEEARCANLAPGEGKHTAPLHYLRYKTQPAGPKRVIVDADSSFDARTDPKSRSRAGWTVALVPDDAESLDSSCAHVLCAISRNINRVTKSTLSTEGVAHCAGLEEAIRVAGWYAELLGPIGTTMQEITLTESGGALIPIDACTDARPLYDVITSAVDPSPADTGAILWFRWIREVYQKSLVRRAIWKGTDDMLADVLTKSGVDSSRLRSAMADGEYWTQYACFCGGGVVDAYKGMPPSKKDREGKPQEAEAWFAQILLAIVARTDDA